MVVGNRKTGWSNALDLTTITDVSYFDPLQHLDITFRRDPTNYRPRINKVDSAKDREQKSAGSYYYLDD